MKYSKTKLNRAVASLKSTAQDGITNGPHGGDISKAMAEEIMIVLDRLSKLETFVAQLDNTQYILARPLTKPLLRENDS